MSEEADISPSEEFLRAAACAPPVEPPAPEADLVGQTMGRFRILSRLGQGGMGIVYRAKDAVLGREVALKVLPQEVMRDGGRRRRFLREARLAAAINHPNLVAIYDVGEQADRIYLAMELVDGEPLRNKLAAGPMDVSEVLRIGAEMARGIARAHAAGIVHRDLKPENVMVASDGTVKILDFGIATIRATAVDGTTPTESGGSESDLGIVVGTPSYMSPEQAKLRELTDKSDCFSLGVVLYEMLTSKRPFTGTSVFEIVIAIDRDAPEALDSVRPDVPRAVADLVMQCLAKEPAARPNAESIARGLREANGPVADAAVSAGPSASKRLGYAGGVALVALAGTLTFALVRSPAATTTETATPMAQPGPSIHTQPAIETAVLASTPPASAAPSASFAPLASAKEAATTSAASPRAGKAPAASSVAPPSSAAPGTSPSPPSTPKRDPLADPI